jgi:hypothetical protein
MQEIKMSDYYNNEDENNVIKRIQDRLQSASSNSWRIDGIEMIDKFVMPYKLAKMNRGKISMKEREQQVKRSYGIMTQLQKQGHFNHITIPPTDFEKAVERKYDDKFQLNGLLPFSPKSY